VPGPDELERDLNPEQLEAVTWGDGPLVVFAGAGSGKTRVITYRIIHLVRERGVHPSRILGLTFTNKAAAEMRERVSAHMIAGTKPPFLGTFHSFCARLLRIHGEAIGVSRDFAILDDQDQIAVIKKVLRELELDQARYQPRAIRSIVERAKREGGISQSLEGRTNPARAQALLKIFHGYEESLSRQGGLDFTDLILKANDLLESDTEAGSRLRSRYEHVLVDEYQDTDRMQAKLLRLLAPPPDASVCVVGDDDQSIYRWRGADVRNILDFRGSYPFAHIVTLERNYRSTGNILEAASAVISHNTDRAEKKLWTEQGRGDPIVRYDAPTEREEARFVAQRIGRMREDDVPLARQAVLYRVHAQSRAIEEAFNEKGLRYRIVGGVRFYDRAEVRDLLAFMRLALNPGDDVALARIINRPPRGLGDKALDTIRSVARREDLSLHGAASKVARGGQLTQRARDSLSSLVGSITQWHQASQTDHPSKILEQIIEDTGYVEALKRSNEPESESRVMNVRELLVAIREIEIEDDQSGLRALLERIALTSSTDAAGADEDAVVMMTVHAAKGLEFDSVIITGLEEDLFPMRGWSSEEELDASEMHEQMHEERRLFYVAVTRARRHLALTCSRSRRIFGGSSRYRAPSPFLDSVPARCVQIIGPPPGRPASSILEPPPARGLGMRVMHKRFGPGIVVNVEEGVRRKLVIKFGDGRIRKIIEEFVKPL
jgi:DNA helicase-2/ATP-dependent DNA helicase PcrA